MVGMMDYIVVIGAVIAMSAACSINIRKMTFSTSTFLTATTIAISVMVWQEMLPFTAIVFCALIIVIMLFGDKVGVPTNE